MAVAGRSARRQHERHAERGGRGGVRRRTGVRDPSCRPDCLADSGASKYGGPGRRRSLAPLHRRARGHDVLRLPAGRPDHAARAVSARRSIERTIALVDRGARSFRRLWPRISHEHGFPIRYGYVTQPWPGSMYQTVFATEPGSAEMPSAGRPFTPELVTRLVSRGVEIAPVLLHTGVASLESHEPPYEEYLPRAAPHGRTRQRGQARRPSRRRGRHDGGPRTRDRDGRARRRRSRARAGRTS